MTGLFRTVGPAGLKSALHDGGEIAVLEATDDDQRFEILAG